MLAIEEIVPALRISRTELSSLFLQAQVGLLPERRMLFEAVARSAADADAYAEALRYAQTQGWLETLVDAIIDQGLEDGRLAQAFAEAVPGNATLQAMANVAAGFIHPHVLYRGIANGMRWTGKVLVDGVARGTGVLIGPNLLLTAWHVVKELFLPAGAGGWTPDPAAGSRLQIELGDFLALVSRGRELRPVGPLCVPAKDTRDWCVVFCRCHTEELQDRLPANLADLEGFWDYAVIRLAAAPGLERRWAALDARAAVPKPSEKVFVFQHPKGQPMKVDDHLIAKADANLQAFVPRYRFLHRTNALPGSSGGPCFDKSFALFGLHQGVWASGANSNNQVTNRGIPIVRVLEHIQTEIQALPGLDASETPIWDLGASGNYLPVLGTEDFQSVVWRSAVSGRPKLLVVTGAERSGKSFHVKLLAAMLPDGGHLKVALSAQTIAKVDAAKLAAMICATAGAAVPVLTPLSELNSTQPTWLRDEVLPKIVAALEQARSGRLVWISLTDLNHFEVEGEASQLLLLLYEQTLGLDWLRIVLDGMKGDLPDAVRDLTERHRTTQLSRREILTYYQRFRADLDLPVEDLGLKAVAIQQEQAYLRALDDDPKNALRRLAEEVRNMSKIYVEAAQG